MNKIIVLSFTLLALQATTQAADTRLSITKKDLRWLESRPVTGIWKNYRNDRKHLHSIYQAVINTGADEDIQRKIKCHIYAPFNLSEENFIIPFRMNKFLQEIKALSAKKSSDYLEVFIDQGFKSYTKNKYSSECKQEEFHLLSAYQLMCNKKHNRLTKTLLGKYFNYPSSKYPSDLAKIDRAIKGISYRYGSGKKKIYRVQNPLSRQDWTKYLQDYRMNYLKNAPSTPNS